MTEKVDIYLEEHRWQVMADLRAVEWGDESPRARLESTITSSKQFRRQHRREGIQEALPDTSAAHLGALVLRCVYNVSDNDASGIIGIPADRFALRALVARQDEGLKPLFKGDGQTNLEYGIERIVSNPHRLEADDFIEWLSLMSELPTAKQAFRSLTLRKKVALLTIASGTEMSTVVKPEFCFEGNDTRFMLSIYDALDLLKARVIAPLEPFYGLEPPHTSAGFKTRQEVGRRLRDEEDYQFWASRIDPSTLEIVEKISSGVSPTQLAEQSGLDRKAVAKRFRSGIAQLDRLRQGHVQHGRNDLEMTDEARRQVFCAEGTRILSSLPNEHRFLLLARLMGMSSRDLVFVTSFSLSQVDGRVRDALGYIVRYLPMPENAPNFHLRQTTALDRLREKLSSVPRHRIMLTLPKMGVRHREVIMQVLLSPAESGYSAVPHLAHLTVDQASEVANNAGRELFALL